MLREVEGMDTAETAACLGLTVDTIKARLHRAKAMLRDDLYRRIGSQSVERCDRLVKSVMDRLALPRPLHFFGLSQPC